jgi:hypothetical protein
MLAERLLYDYPSLPELVIADLGHAPEDHELVDLAEALYRLSLRGHPGDSRLMERLGETYHLRRRLAEAGDWYLAALAATPPDTPSPAVISRILHHAPTLLTTEAEFFALRDVAAIHHPTQSLIVYHLFWEDDYNFPDDYDPCDHEQVWVSYDPGDREGVGGRVTAVHTFFHSLILNTSAAVEEANDNGGRPRIRVEWGLHGSLPRGWEKLQSPLDNRPVQELLADNYRSVSRGGRVPDHPLKRFWPKRFPGTFYDYQRFDRPVAAVDLLQDKKMIMVSALSNAVIQQYFLHYNFAPKFDWPFQQLPIPHSLIAIQGKQ